MAEVTRVHGNALNQGTPATGSNITADELVILNGASMDFFKIVQQDVSGDV